MKTYRAEQRTQTVQVLEKTVCDVCGQPIQDLGSYDVDEVTVSRRWGVGYPDGGSGHEINVDMHGDCFMNKLVPWLKAQGAEVETVDWEY